jgi:glycerol-3-phosphate acyltransferase PlsY
MLSLLIIIVFSYLIGSFPTAILVSQIVMKDDIRNHGSGNAGATNVFRVMGWKPALFVVLVDVGKGIIAVLFISKIGGNTLSLDHILVQILAGLSAIVGHIWTVFAGFRGGKGVGTAFGVLLVLAPWASLCTLVVWLLLVFSTRIVSIGSISAGIVFPGILFLQRYVLDTAIPDALLILGIVLGILVVITHRSNIGRLIRGEENRFGKKTTTEQCKG